MASGVMQGKHTRDRSGPVCVSVDTHEDLCVDNLSASFLA